MQSATSGPKVYRAEGTTFDGDDPAGVFTLLADGASRGLAGALITIVDIEGGAPKPLGAHMAVLADGRYCGYVSGGCVEAAVAAEALKVLQSGKDAVLRFGLNSPFIDIRLPCGGGIDLLVNVVVDPSVIDQAIAAFARREAFSLELPTTVGGARMIFSAGADLKTGQDEKVFFRRYLPDTKLLLIGQGLEFEALLRMAKAARLSLEAFSPDDQSVVLAGSLGVPYTRLVGPSGAQNLAIDRWTAVVFLFHDHDWETAFMMQILESPAFYVGALGSRNTHAARCGRLRERGLNEAALARIHGPLGLFGPTRDATSLAVSALAQIVEERRIFDAL